MPMPMTPTLVNDPDLGVVTEGCDTCADLRARMRTVEHGDHPVKTLTIFVEQRKHLEATGHETFGWQFTIKVRHQADEFIARNDELSGFWVDFKAKYLRLPILGGLDGQE